MDRYENQQFLQRELQKGLEDAYFLVQAQRHWEAIEELQEWEAKWDRIIVAAGSKIPPAYERYLNALYCECFQYGPLMHAHAAELAQDTLQEHPPPHDSNLHPHDASVVNFLKSVALDIYIPIPPPFGLWISDPNVAINYANTLEHGDAVIQTTVYENAPTPSLDTDIVPLDYEQSSSPVHTPDIYMELTPTPSPAWPTTIYQSSQGPSTLEEISVPLSNSTHTMDESASETSPDSPTLQMRFDRDLLIGGSKWTDSQSPSMRPRPISTQDEDGYRHEKRQRLE